MKNEIIVKGIKVQVLEKNNSDYISLTDMTSGFRDGSGLIGKWISNKNTLEYIGIREKIHNPQFNYPEFGVIELESGVNRFFYVCWAILALYFLIIYYFCNIV
jgi:hypothetical protein